MKLPERIQRKRTKEARLPERTLYVGRPSKWGNPYTGADALTAYKRWVKFKVGRGSLDLRELLEYDYLACWCPLDQPCHVDVLLELLREAMRDDPNS